MGQTVDDPDILLGTFTLFAFRIMKFGPGYHNDKLYYLAVNFLWLNEDFSLVRPKLFGIFVQFFHALLQGGFDVHAPLFSLQIEAIKMLAN